MLRSVILLLFSANTVFGVIKDRVTAKTPYGTFIGQRRKEHYDIGSGAVTDTVNEWLGVKYGVAARWQTSRLPDESNETFDSIWPFPSCPQVHYYQHTFFTNQFEDCLYLNIYAPKSRRRTLYPVMVFIHGGSYEEGTGMRYDAFPLAAHGVVVVSINYRLAELGFLTTGNDILRGNYGIEDQILALQWISKAISSFGGDAKRVTLFGSSAGAASIGLIMTMPQADDLYHAVILQSGSPLAFWALHGQDVQFTKQVHEVAQLVGCKGANLKDQVNCMSTVNESLFAEIHFQTERYSPSGLDLKPRVDGKVITKSPHEAYLRGEFNKVPVITGFVKDEWARNAGLFFDDLPESVIDRHLHDGMDRGTFIKVLHHVMAVRLKWPTHIVDIVVQTYTNTLDGSNPIKNRDKYVEWMGDICMYAPIIKLVNHLSQYDVPVHMYEFEHPSTHSPVDWWGTYHSLELDYVFGSPFTGFSLAIDNYANYTSSDRTISRLLMSLWSNFAKTRNPNSETSNANLGKFSLSGINNQTTGLDKVEWKSYDSQHQSYLHLSTNAVEIRHKYKPFRMTFWNELMPKLMKLPSKPDSMFVTEACWERHAIFWVLVLLCITLFIMLTTVCIAYLNSRKRVRKLQVIYTTSAEARKCLS